MIYIMILSWIHMGTNVTLIGVSFIFFYGCFIYSIIRNSRKTEEQNETEQRKEQLEKWNQK